MSTILKALQKLEAERREPRGAGGDAGAEEAARTPGEGSEAPVSAATAPGEEGPDTPGRGSAGMPAPPSPADDAAADTDEEPRSAEPRVWRERVSPTPRVRPPARVRPARPPAVREDFVPAPAPPVEPPPRPSSRAPFWVAVAATPILLAAFVWWLLPGSPEAPSGAEPGVAAGASPSPGAPAEPPSAVLPEGWAEVAPLVIDEQGRAMPGRTGPAPPAVAEAAPSPGEAPLPGSEPAPGSAESSVPPAAPPAEGPAASPPRVAARPAAPAATPAPTSPGARRAPSAATPAAPPASPAARPAVPAPTPPAPAADPPTPSAPAPAKPAPARVASVPPPPEIRVEGTAWHPSPERRTARVVVQGRAGVLELHEGDAVGTLVVSEIQPSGVVFLHGGAKLRRGVGDAP